MPSGWAASLHVVARAPSRAQLPWHTHLLQRTSQFSGPRPTPPLGAEEFVLQVKNRLNGEVSALLGPAGGPSCTDGLRSSLTGRSSGRRSHDVPHRALYLVRASCASDAPRQWRPRTHSFGESIKSTFEIQFTCARIMIGKLHNVHVSSASELENYLSTHHPETVEIEYQESDTLLGTWSELPEFPLLQVASHFGYKSVHRRTGGTAPFFGWMGPGDRYVVFTLHREATQRREQ